MAKPLTGMLDNIKQARESRLQGLYDTSIILFDTALAQINE
jgi:hypothetical protein